MSRFQAVRACVGILAAALLLNQPQSSAAAALQDVERASAGVAVVVDDRGSRAMLAAIAVDYRDGSSIFRTRICQAPLGQCETYRWDLAPSEFRLTQVGVGLYDGVVSFSRSSIGQVELRIPSLLGAGSFRLCSQVETTTVVGAAGGEIWEGAIDGVIGPWRVSAAGCGLNTIDPAAAVWTSPTELLGGTA